MDACPDVRRRSPALRAAAAALLVLAALFFLVSAGDAGSERRHTISGPASLSLIVEPRDGVRPVVRWIDRAQTSIFVAAYILTDRSIVRALERAAAQGVQVYVELDPHPFGLPAQPSRMSSQLQAADVHVRWSRPGFTYSHAKYIVIDDRVALIGTANYSVSAFSKNREFILVDRSTRDVLSLSSLFRADWDRLSAQLRDPNLVIAPGSARRQLTGLARSARRTLDVYAEEFADPALEGLFGQMARRVRVRVLLPPGATPLDARRLAASGVSVRSLVAPYSHAKAVLVDGTRGFVGSENMSSTSLDHNREVGVLLPPPLVRKIEVYFARDWRAGRPVSRLSAHREGR